MARFVVTSISGYSGHGGTHSAGKPSTFWQVLDSVYCYATVWEGGDRGRALGTAEATARALAARLEADHAS